MYAEISKYVKTRERKILTFKYLNFKIFNLLLAPIAKKDTNNN